MINGFLMVRLGLAEAKSMSIWTSPKYGSSWKMKSSSALKAYLRQLEQLLKTLPDGPYAATAFVFGRPTADRISRTQGLIHSSAGKNKRTINDAEFGEDDESSAPEGSMARRRKE
jgi:hypothetical protein